MDEDVLHDLVGILVCVILGGAVIGLMTWVLTIVA